MRPPSSSPRRTAHYLSANAYDFYTGLGWEDHATTTFNPQGPNGAIYSPQVSVGATQQVPRPAGGIEATQNVSCDTQFLRPRGTLLYSCGQAETLSVDARVSLSWQQLGQAGAHHPARRRTRRPAPLTNLVRLVSNLQGLALPGDVPTPGPSGEATTVRPDGTLVIALSPTKAQSWQPTAADLAGYVQRATAAQAQTPNAPPITRLLIATPATATPDARSATDARFAAIEAEQERLRKQLIDTQLVVRDGKVTMLLYHGQTPNFADVTTLDAGAPLAANETVATTARVSTATADQLRARGDLVPAVAGPLPRPAGRLRAEHDRHAAAGEGPRGATGAAASATHTTSPPPSSDTCARPMAMRRSSTTHPRTGMSPITSSSTPKRATASTSRRR